MNELIKLSAAAIVIKTAKIPTPDFINKMIGRPTRSQVKKMQMIKKLLPIVGSLGLGALGLDAISKQDKSQINDPEALKELMNKRRLHDVMQGAALALAAMPDWSQYA